MMRKEIGKKERIKYIKLCNMISDCECVENLEIFDRAIRSDNTLSEKTIMCLCIFIHNKFIELNDLKLIK